MTNSLKKIIVTTGFVSSVLLASATGSFASNFTGYPGLDDEKAVVEVATDKGLVVEMILRCNRQVKGEPLSGIMTYSKLDRLYCSSNHRCFDTLEPAARMILADNTNSHFSGLLNARTGSEEIPGAGAPRPRRPGAQHRNSRE